MTASDDKTARLWSREGKPLATLGDGKDRPDPLQRIAASFGPDGRYLLTLLGGDRLRVWPLTERAFIDRIRQIAKPCHDLADRQRAFPDEESSVSRSAVERCLAQAR